MKTIPENTTLSQLVKYRKAVVQAIKEGKTYPTIQDASQDLEIPVDCLQVVLADNGNELGSKLNILTDAEAMLRMCESLNQLQEDVRQSAKGLAALDRMSELESEIKNAAEAYISATDAEARTQAADQRVKGMQAGMEKRFEQFMADWSDEISKLKHLGDLMDRVHNIEVWVKNLSQTIEEHLTTKPTQE
jgi:hypothetical protein